MRGVGQEAIKIAAKRKEFAETAYELFSAKNIESVSLQDIADATGYGIATLYRYFVNKPTLVVEAAAWKWEQIEKEVWERRNRIEEDHKMTAAEELDYYLNSFLELYQNHKGLLRFNQLFNIYIQNEDIKADAMKPFQETVSLLKDQFHVIYDKAGKDHTVRTDVTEEEMFSTTLHLMLAALTRYAVGLAYKPETGFDPMKELETQKRMLLREYSKK